MMLRNCAECNRVFSHPVQKLCPSCLSEKEELFNKVKQYLIDHPLATISEVSEATGVDTDRILEFLREGRLQIKPTDVTLRCKICDEEIESGTVCDKCRKKLNPSLETAERPIQRRIRPQVTEVEQRHTGRVHLLDSIRRRKKS